MNGEQIGMFDGEKPYKINKPIRLIELFAGIGSQAKALQNIGADFEHYRICEFDKYAVQSYNAVHGTQFETSDITKINASDLGITDTDKYEYIMTYSFPCTDLSKAGQQKGMAKGSGTRSGLLWEVERLLDECEELPQVLLMENVPDVIGTKNISHFANWIKKLETLGYHNYWKLLNAKNFGIPQNRNRTFMVSLLGDYFYEFPQATPLKKRLKDMLETEVDEKYYLSEKAIKYITSDKRYGSWCKINQEVAMTVNAVGQTNWTGDFILEPQLEQVAQLNGFESSGRIYSENELCPTINTMGGGGREPKIIEPLAYDEQNKILRVDGTVGTLTTDGSSPKHNNRVIEPLLVGGIGDINFGSQYRQGNRVYDSEEIACALGASPVGNAGGYSYLYKVEEPTALLQENEIFDAYNKTTRTDGICGTITANGNTSSTHCGTFFVSNSNNYRIRKLTPKECWRLMGFADSDFDKAKASGVSNSQLYKQAGNSIVVNVLEAIFKQMTAKVEV